MLLAAVALTVTALCPEDATCLEADRIRVVAAGPGRAETLLDLALGAQALFEAEFGVAAGPVAVVEDLQTFPGLSIELAEAGYRVKPWISPMAMRQTLEAQIRPVMEQRLSAAGLPEAAIDAQVENVLNDRVDQNEKVRHQDAIIPHELGHLWLIEGFAWPERERDGSRSYGAAAAPDWLDETFAVALETQALTAERRSGTCSALPEDLPGQVATFLTMEHPLLDAASAMADAQARARAAAEEQAEQGSEPRIMVTSLESLGVNREEGVVPTGQFYNLSRVMVDYAEATTGGVHVFSDLARHLADGGSQESWLATQSHGWPQDITTLSQSVAEFVGVGCAA